MLAVNEDEVKNVRLVYYMLMGGRSMAEIAAILAGLGWEIGLWKMCTVDPTRAGVLPR